VVKFSMATDLIEQFKQIGHFARQLARIVEEWAPNRVDDSHPVGT
jgi:hypothetical protein